MALQARLWAKVTIASGAQASSAFMPPEGCGSMTIHTPATLTGTLSLQALAPKESENETDAWSTIYVFDLNAGGANIALDAIPQAVATCIPYTAFGAGPLRLYSSGAEAAAREMRIAFIEN